MPKPQYHEPCRTRGFQISFDHQGFFTMQLNLSTTATVVGCANSNTSTTFEIYIPITCQKVVLVFKISAKQTWLHFRALVVIVTCTLK